MGFDQERTTHHFVLEADGGIISVEANDLADVLNRDAIRTHMRRIATDFAAGRYSPESLRVSRLSIANSRCQSREASVFVQEGEARIDFQIRNPS